MLLAKLAYFCDVNRVLTGIFLSCAAVEGISNKLKVDISKGLGGGDFPSRTKAFGNNDREALKAKSFCTVFFEALDDFMLKVLIVAATGSLIFEYIGADSEDYGHGKCKFLPWASCRHSGSRLAQTQASLFFSSDG